MYKYKGRISEEMYHQACAVDLYAFLTSRHSDRVRQKYGSALLLENEHVSVKKGFHGFTNFRSGETGNNVTYLCSFLDYGYRDAVLALLDFSGGLTEFGNNIDYDPMSLKKAKIRAASKEHYALPEKLDLKDFTIPKPINGRYRHLFAYLRNRGIPVETIKTLVDEGILYQDAKETLYVSMLLQIVSSISEPVIVVTFDAFGNAAFEKKIIQEVGCMSNVYSIKQDFSYNSKGLQFAENVCGVIRKHITGNDSDGFFEIIEKRIWEIK